MPSEKRTKKRGCDKGIWEAILPPALALSQLHDHVRSVLFGFICFAVLHRSTTTTTAAIPPQGCAPARQLQFAPTIALFMVAPPSASGHDGLSGFPAKVPLVNILHCRLHRSAHCVRRL